MIKKESHWLNLSFQSMSSNNSNTKNKRAILRRSITEIQHPSFNENSKLRIIETAMKRF